MGRLSSRTRAARNAHATRWTAEALQRHLQTGDAHVVPVAGMRVQDETGEASTLRTTTSTSSSSSSMWFFQGVLVVTRYDALFFPADAILTSLLRKVYVGHRFPPRPGDVAVLRVRLLLPFSEPNGVLAVGPIIPRCLFTDGARNVASLRACTSLSAIAIATTAHLPWCASYPSLPPVSRLQRVTITAPCLLQTRSRLRQLARESARAVEV